VVTTELERIAPVTRLTTRGSCSHAPEVNAGTQIARAKLSRHQLIALDHFSIRTKNGEVATSTR
jgi:hypothetical protein